MEKQKAKSENVEKFLGEYGEAFDTLDKKAAFLEGVLVKFLLDVQYANRKSTPFMTKLHGLKLDETKIKILLPEIVEKLREYDISYPWLEELTSKYLVEADATGWNLSKDEISYYFVLGLCLGGLFKDKENSEKGGR